MDSLAAPSIPAKARASVQTLDRAVAILEALARTGPGTLADLVRETGLPRPTAHRLAVALEEHALVAWAGDRDRFDVDARVLAAVRTAGWAATVGEREPGVASVSAPVRVGG